MFENDAIGIFDLMYVNVEFFSASLVSFIQAKLHWYVDQTIH